MEDILIAAGVIGLLYLVIKRTAPAQVATQTPAPPVPLAPGISSGQVVIGDSYGVPPWGSVVNAPGAVTPTTLPSTVNPPPGLPPPGGTLGGIAGGIGGLFGTGGLPLGGPLTPGVTVGTGTSAPVVDVFGRARIVNGVAGNKVPGYDIFGRPVN